MAHQQVQATNKKSSFLYIQLYFKQFSLVYKNSSMSNNLVEYTKQFYIKQFSLA